jgi:hypothetical protein
VIDADKDKLALTGKVNIIESDSFQQALSMATEEAGNTGGRHILW